MNEHLSQESIYSYLDRELPNDEWLRAEAHLTRCEDCRLRLAAARHLFQSIAGVPEQALEVDLQPRVMEAIRPATRWLPSLAVAQLLAALAVAVGLLLGLGSTTVSMRVTEAAQQVGIGLETSIQAGLQSAASTASTLPNIRFDIGLPAVWTIAAAALACWALGNGLVLGRMTRRS